MKMNKILYQDFIETIEYKNFCNSVKILFRLLEEENSLSIYEFRCKLHGCLSEVYALSWKLPIIELQFENDKSDLCSNEEIKKFNSDLCNKLGNENFYYEVFNPFHPEENEPTQGWLVDDVSDIYKEIKNGILKIETGKAEYIEDGIWDITFGRNNHWGNHAVNVIRALHYGNYN